MEVDEAVADPVWQFYRSVSDDDTLQQGDLIRFADGEPWRLGLVVTADCDLDKRKHSRLVTLVPLLTVNDVICRCLAFELFDKYKNEFDSAARQAFNIELNAGDAGFLGRVKARLLEGAFSEPTHEHLAKVTAQLSFHISIDVLKSLIQTIGVAWNKVSSRFSNQISARGDLLLLTSPPLVGQGEKIAWLRALWQEEVSAIALKTSESSDRRGVRVAQLASPFRYRLTQMLGQVFADIGLPDLPVPSIEQELSGEEG